GLIPVDGKPVGVAIQGNELVVATLRSGLFQPAPPELTVFDVSNSSLPIRRGTIDLPGDDVRGVAIRDQLAFVAMGALGVTVVELEDPGAPERVATVPVVGVANSVAIASDLLLVAAGSGGLRVLDLTNPRLGELGFLALPGQSQAISVQGT